MCFWLNRILVTPGNVIPFTGNFYSLVKSSIEVDALHIFFIDAHVSHLEETEEDELNRLLGIVMDVENLFVCVHKEEDADTKQVYFYLFRVILLQYTIYLIIVRCPMKT